MCRIREREARRSRIVPRKEINIMMNAGDIAFPHLGIYLENVPRSFSVFGFEIAFYGLIIGIGVLAGILMAVHQAKVTGENPDTIWDFAIYAVIFSVIGARIYYVIIGRWGNFMNREVFGEYTDSFLAMRLPIEAVRSRDISENVAAHIIDGTNYIQVHPTFLYESLWNLMILILMLVYRKHKKFEGEICLLYFGGYGLGRFWIEGIRTDTLFIPGTTLAVSQVLSLCMVIFAVVTDVVVRIRLEKQPKVEKY